MMTDIQPTTMRARRTWLHVLILLALSLVVFFPGLDRHGVTNWQEAQRLVVAREMQDRFRVSGGDWRELIVPTANGQPYIAKPPMIYWGQIGLAWLDGGKRVELWHLRLLVALAGVIGVLATYFAAREMLTPDRERWLSSGATFDEKWVDHAALWAGLSLATAVLFVRSGRIGELDILLASLCAVAIAGVARAWRVHRMKRATSYLGVTTATIAGTLAVMCKDPAVMIVGLAGFASIGLHSAMCPAGTRLDVWLVRNRGREEFVSAPKLKGLPRVMAWGLAAMGGVGAGVLSGRHVQDAADGVGVALIAVAGGFVGWMLGALTEPIRLRATLVAMSRTHPIVVIGVPVVVRLIWGWQVKSIIGADKLATLTNAEVEDNIRLFVPQAPLNNLEVMVFGAGIGSAALIVGLVWLVRKRVKFEPGWYLVLGWVLFTLIALSVLGKGVGRYLTPTWPGVAIAAGGMIATFLQTRPWMSRRYEVGLWCVVISLALGQSWWYGYGREMVSVARSPRDLMRELAKTPGVDLGKIVSVDFSHPALDYYVGSRVQPVGNVGVNESMAGGKVWSYERLVKAVHNRGKVIALMRSEESKRSPMPSPVKMLRDWGLMVTPIELQSRFEIDKGRSEIRAYRLTPGQSVSPAP